MQSQVDLFHNSVSSKILDHLTNAIKINEQYNSNKSRLGLLGAQSIQTVLIDELQNSIGILQHIKIDISIFTSENTESDKNTENKKGSSGTVNLPGGNKENRLYARAL